MKVIFFPSFSSLFLLQSSIARELHSAPFLKRAIQFERLVSLCRARIDTQESMSNMSYETGAGMSLGPSGPQFSHTLSGFPGVSSQFSLAKAYSCLYHLFIVQYLAS